MKKVLAIIAGACIALLLADYIVATVRKPRPGDDKRVTAARLARKRRDNAVAWVLIASAGLFLMSAGRRKRLPHQSTNAQTPTTAGLRTEVGQAFPPAHCAPDLDLT